MNGTSFDQSRTFDQSMISKYCKVDNDNNAASMRSSAMSSNPVTVNFDGKRSFVESFTRASTRTAGVEEAK